MEQRLEILDAGQTCGTLTIREAGLYLLFSAECTASGCGVHRLRLHGENGEQLLGIPVPGDGRLTFDKRISKREFSLLQLGTLRHCTLDGDAPAAPPQRAEQPDGWRPCEDPRALFQDPELAAVCPTRGACVKSRGEAVLLALPLIPGSPFPLLPVFRFGHTEEIGGRNFVVFELKDGNPC